VLRVGSEFQAAGLIEAVYGMNQADHAGTCQIVECDARRYPALEASRDSVHQIEVLKSLIGVPSILSTRLSLSMIGACGRSIQSGSPVTVRRWPLWKNT
jgi:hypothetical protein